MNIFLAVFESPLQETFLGLPETLKSPTYSTSVGILLWGINHPIEQVNYGGHQPQKKKTLTKGRKWLNWLTQFISPKF